MRRVVILRGVPGSGKSTFHKSEFPGAVVVSADHFFEDGNGVYRFDPTKLPEAHASCLRRFMRQTEPTDGAPLVVVDNTNTTVAEVSPYVAIGQAMGYEVEIISLEVPLDQLHEAAKRNVHGVPGTSVAAMAARMVSAEGQFPPWWKHRKVQAGGL